MIASIWGRKKIRKRAKKLKKITTVARDSTLGIPCRPSMPFFRSVKEDGTTKSHQGRGQKNGREPPQRRCSAPLFSVGVWRGRLPDLTVVSAPCRMKSRQMVLPDHRQDILCCVAVRLSHIRPEVISKAGRRLRSLLLVAYVENWGIKELGIVELPEFLHCRGRAPCI